jgi:serine protease Do
VSLAADPERIFSEALDYTVRVKTIISTPFIEDRQGVFTGAGFIIDVDRGWVITNAHVVGRSPSTVRVSLYGEPYQDASKLYVDPYIDLAILEVPMREQGVEQARLNCDAEPTTGHPVGAFGHPWNLDYTGTQGVISGKTSNFRGELLQTDAPINSGNSGGPLISLNTGRIVGINTASIDDEADQNTNFAIPAIHACKIVDLLKAGRDPSPPAFDVIFYDTQDGSELIVSQSYLSEGDIALQRNDEILEVDSEPVENEGQLINELRGRVRSVTLTVRRGGAVITLRGGFSPRPLMTERQGIYVAGLVIASSNYRDAVSLGSGHDLTIHYIESGSEAQSAELQYYDHLSSVDGIRVSDIAHARELIEASSHQESTWFEFKRFSFENGQIYEHIRRVLPVTDLDLMGNWTAP